MQKIKKNKEYLIVAITLLVFSMGVFYKTLFLGKTFAWYNDQLFQHNVFYQEWYRLIKECIRTKTLSVYSWNTFLGTDFLVSKLMYCVGDFLITPFFIIWNGDINYDLLYAITTIITIVISGITMLMYLKKFGISKTEILITISIVYALGGFAMTYTGTYMFHRFYCLLPLLFYFCERYIQDSKTVGFSIITALLFLQSYELLFSTAFFLILYFIVSNKLRYEIDIKEILKKSIRLIISFLIGLLLCGTVLIPLIIYLKSNPRVAGYSYDGLVWNYRTIVGFMTNLFVPAFNFRSGNPNYLFYTGSHYSNEYGYFTSVLIVLAFICLFKNGNLKEKRLFGISEIIIVLCLLIKPLNSIIHGLSVATLRWSFLLEYFHLIIISYIFNKYELNSDNKKEISIIYALYIFIYMIFIVVYKISLKDYLMSLMINLLMPAVLYIYNCLFIHKNKNTISIFTIATVMCFYVISIYGTYGIYDNKEVTYNKEYLSYMEDTEEDLMARYHFYSKDLWPYSWLNLNESIENEYMGVTTYDSTYESVLSNFLEQNDYDSWMISIDNPNIAQMLGVKYWVVSNDEELPDGMQFELITTLNSLQVYELNNYNHIGHTYSDFVTETDYQDFDCNNTLKIDPADYDLVSDIEDNDKVQLVVEEYNNQYMKGALDVSDKSVLFVAIPYSSGWTVCNQDGNQLKTVNVNDGFLGIIVDENVKEISFNYLTPGIKTGAIISGLGLIFLIFEIILDKSIKYGLYK